MGRPKSGCRFAIEPWTAARVPTRIFSRADFPAPVLPSPGHGHQLSRRDSEARHVQYQVPAVDPA
ncbi:MAG: hypothetical protein ACRDPD_34420 [Streptosporangiaceae bacterium]